MNNSFKQQSAQFELLIKQNTGSNLDVVISNILESSLLNIEHLISLTNIQNHKDTPSYETLLLFSRGTYEDYISEPSKYIKLTNKMLNKLKQLTLISLASKEKVMTYSFVMKELELKEEFELDQLLFDSFINQSIKMKVDNLNKLIKILEVKPRDYVNDWTLAEYTLNQWINRIENWELFLESQNKEVQKCTDCFHSFIIQKEEQLINSNKK